MNTRATTWTVAAALVGTAVVVAVGVQVLAPGDTPPGAAATDADTPAAADGLPDVDTGVAAATRQWLAKDGAALLVMHTQATGLVAGDDCYAVVADLSADAPADEVLAAAAGAPDDVLGEALLAQRRQLGVAVADCAMDGDAVNALATTTELVDARLDQLAVDRPVPTTDANASTPHRTEEPS